MNYNPNYWLLGTTTTFMIPLMYAHKKEYRSLSYSTALALIGSLNYWKNPDILHNRTIDLITSRLSLASYIFYGYRNIYKVYPSIIGYFNLLIMSYFYNLSCKKYEKNDLTWINYHMIFHLYTTFSKLYIIYLL